MKSNHLILQMKKMSPRKLKSKCSMQCNWILCVLLVKECNDLSKRRVKSQAVENKISDSFENWNLFNHGSFFFSGTYNFESLCCLWRFFLLQEGISSVQSLSPVRLFVTPWTAARQASLSITNSWNSPKPMSIESMMPSSHLILCCPLFLLPPIFPSIRVFSNESALRIRWPKYWSFSFNISPSNEHPGLISFRMDWLYLLAVQGALKSLLQHQNQSSKASILQRSAFFIVQLSHPYMITGKTHSLD